jgi:hypothetical protein
MQKIYKKLVLIAASCSVVTAFSINRMGSPSFRLACVGKTIDNPLPQPERDAREDNDPSWRTPTSNIIAVNREKFTVRPEIITFDAVNTLIEPSQSMGRWFREALNLACDMRIRLPRPALFTAAFNKAYADMYVTAEVLISYHRSNRHLLTLFDLLGPSRIHASEHCQPILCLQRAGGLKS